MKVFLFVQKKWKLYSKEKPYIIEYTKKILEEKCRVLKLYTENPITYGSAYREIRNKVNSADQAAKRRYYQDEIYKISKI